MKELKELLYAKLQVNCSTLLQKHYGRAFLTLRKMLKEQLIDYVATDAHDDVIRKCEMAECFEFLERSCGREYAQKITFANQSEIIFGHSENFNI